MELLWEEWWQGRESPELASDLQVSGTYSVTYITSFHRATPISIAGVPTRQPLSPQQTPIPMARMRKCVHRFTN